MKNEIEHFVEEDDIELLKKEQSSYRVGTYNILSSRIYQKDAKLSWSFRKDIVLDAIKKSGVDLLALQEVRSDQLAFICENLPEYGVIGYSEHCGKSLEEMELQQLTGDDIREIVPILYRKDQFKLLSSRVWFLSDTPNKVSTAQGASRPRILVAGAFECLMDNTIIIASNTHYDHQNNTERLMKAGHLEAQFIEEFSSSFQAHDIIYMGDRNSFINQEGDGFEACDGDEYYRQFKQETHAQDTREMGRYFGAATTFIGYEPDKFKAPIKPDSESFEPTVLDLIYYKGQGTILKSLNSLVEYELPQQEEKSEVKVSVGASLCTFFGKPKNIQERQFGSDHTYYLTDISHS